MTTPSNDAPTLLERFPVLRFFSFDHLPDGPLKDVSRRYSELANYTAMQESAHPAEKATALRKLLEAKDAAVRCVLPA